MNTEILVCLIIIGVAGLHALAVVSSGGKRITLVDLALWMSALYLGGGPLISYSLGYEPYTDSAQAPWRVLGAVLIYYTALLGAKNFYFSNLSKVRLPPRSPSVFLVIISGLAKIQLKDLFKLYFILWIVRVVDLVLGGGFSGLNSLQFMLSRPYYIVVTDMLLSPVGWLILMATSVRLFYTKTEMSFALVLFVIEVVYTFSQGRREMLNIVFLCMLALYSVNRRLKVSNMIVGGIVTILLVSYLFPLFLETRSELQRGNSDGDNVAIQKTLRDVMGRDEVDKDLMMESYKLNMQYRALFNYKWMETVILGMKQYGFMHGESIISASMKALPRGLRPTKYWHDHASFLQRHLRIPLSDTADNNIANFYADFGSFSVWAYGFIFSTLLLWGTDIALKTAYSQPLLGVLLFAHLLPHGLSFEASLSDIFTTLRSFLLLFILSKILLHMNIQLGNPFLKKLKLRQAFG